MIRARIVFDGTVATRSTGNRPTDAQLLDAAVAVFRRNGYAAASMAEIATEADTTKPTLYAHFGSKERMYLRAIEREAERLRTVMFETYDASLELPVRDEVRANIVNFFRFAQSNPDGFHLIFGDDARPTAADEVCGRMVQDLNDRISEHIRARTRGAGTEAPRAGADVLANLVVGVAVSGAKQVAVAGVDAEAVAELAVALVADGFIHISADTVARIQPPSERTPQYLRQSQFVNRLA